MLRAWAVVHSSSCPRPLIWHHGRPCLLPACISPGRCWRCHQRGAARRGSLLRHEASPAQRREHAPACWKRRRRQRLAGTTEARAAGQGQPRRHQQPAVPSSEWATLSRDDSSRDDPSAWGYADGPGSDGAQLAGEPWTEDDGDDEDEGSEAEAALETSEEASPLPEMDSVQVVTMQTPIAVVSAVDLHLVHLGITLACTQTLSAGRYALQPTSWRTVVARSCVLRFYREP